MAQYLDAGRRAGGVANNYFVAAATNHDYYWPPAVMATLGEIRSSHNQLFAPNAVDSISLPGGTQVMEFPSSWLKWRKTISRSTCRVKEPASCSDASGQSVSAIRNQCGCIFALPTTGARLSVLQSSQ
jgi:hypothetical protein